MTFRRRTRSQAEIKKIVNLYSKSRKSVSALKEQYNLSGTQLYRMVDNAGVARRELTKA